ncbi:hypothetical protein N9549_06705, partial [Acidimicrobiales bacterium]|nr:hypothetical protein [Acidimicrobiales bacterium]
MARLAISIDFLDGYHRLEKSQRNRVQSLAQMFAKSSAAELTKQKGVHLESYKGAADSRARTIRIGDNHRGVVLDAGNNETFVLTMIGTHKEVDHWMANNRFRVNAATGALEITNIAAVEAAVEEIGTTSAPEAHQLFAHRPDKEFVQLGISGDLLPIIRIVSSEDQLESLLFALPPSQQDALIGLIGKATVEDLYRDV